MKKKIEQILNGKFEYEQPELLFSEGARLEITLEAGSTAQGELYFGTENNDRIQGYVTSFEPQICTGQQSFLRHDSADALWNRRFRYATGRGMYRLAVRDFKYR